MLLWSIAVIYPIIWLFLGAFKSNAEIFASPWGLPKEFHFQNFLDAWNQYNIGMSFYNSVIVTLTGTIITLLLAIPASYALERVAFKGRTFLFNLFISAMMIPVVLGWIPLFFLLMKFNLLNNLFGLALVYSISKLPFSIFILTSFMSSIPKELEEAAAIDGLSPYGILWRIVTPLTATGIITVTIMNAIQFWNEYFMALIFIQSSEKYTLGLAMDFLNKGAQYSSAWGTLFAGLTISVIPVIIIYSVFQRGITKGMIQGAVKG
ncbi:carbohydrate ABC transporter permease [Metabacillus fastidiosus]|uniref:carbohydrate ABC transporter permease n=1 Tax=Metabacillus fastidiosus TaxID=1458 RepID=UPI003D2900A7